MGKPNSGKSYSKSGIARTDRPCYWVSPCGWKRVGPPEIIVVVVVVVVVVEVNIFLYIIIVVTPSARPPLPLRRGSLFLIFLALARARARPPECFFTTTRFCLSPTARQTLRFPQFQRRAARKPTFFKRILTICVYDRFLQFCTVALALRFLWFGAHADLWLSKIVYISIVF